MALIYETFEEKEISAEANAFMEYLLGLKGVVPAFGDGFSVSHTGTNLEIGVGSFIYSGRKFFNTAQLIIEVAPEAVGSATKYVVCNVNGSAQPGPGAFTITVEGTSSGSIAEATTDLIANPSAALSFDLGQFTNSSSGITASSRTMPNLPMLDYEALAKGVRIVYNTLQELGLTAGTTLAGVVNALEIGEVAELYIQATEIAPTSLPEVIVLDNSRIWLQVIKASTGSAYCTLKQIDEVEPLEFTTFFKAGWTKNSWEHVAGVRTLLSGVNLPDGTSFNTLSSSVHWRNCDVDLSVGKIVECQVGSSGTNLEVFTGYKASTLHVTVAGTITNWNNTSPKTVSLNRISHLFNSNHSNPISVAVNAIVGTYYKEVQP